LLPSGYGAGEVGTSGPLLGILLWLNNSLRYIWNSDGRQDENRPCAIRRH